MAIISSIMFSLLFFCASPQLQSTRRSPSDSSPGSDRTPFHLARLPTPPCQTLKTFHWQKVELLLEVHGLQLSCLRSPASQSSCTRGPTSHRGSRSAHTWCCSPP